MVSGYPWAAAHGRGTATDAAAHGRGTATDAAAHGRRQRFHGAASSGTDMGPVHGDCRSAWLRGRDAHGTKIAQWRTRR